MKLTLSRQELTSLATSAQAATGQRSTLQVLSHILLEAYEDSLILMATDLEQAFRATMPATVDQPGRVTVPAGLFTSVLPAMSGDDVTIEADLQSFITLSGQGKGKRTFTIYGSSAENFPVLPQFDDSNLFTVAQFELATAIEQTLYCTSTEPLKYYLQGVLFESDERGLRMVATDSRRLAIFDRFEESGQPEEPFSVIVPQGVLRALEKTLAGSGDLELSLAQKRVHFRFGHIELSSTLIDGRFPDYKRVIPESTIRTIHVQSRELMDGVDAVSKVIEKNTALRISLSDEGIVLSSHKSAKGAGEAEVSVENYEGDPLVLGVNPKYLRDALQRMPDDVVRLRLNGSLEAVVIEPVSDAPPYFAVIMPMRLEDEQAESQDD